ncbi:MAG TPA: hypothetical protein PKW15_00340, partial [Alphaproteobacteria bacterium]|nr:hypothetical protein [Alphaproteobacteria bacterium]
QGRTLEGTLAQHIGMVREANDAMGLQANRMQDNASRMLMSGAMITHDLRDATGQAMAQAEVLSHIIGREADALREISAQSIDQMDEASARMEVSRADLYTAIGETAGQVAQVVSDLDQMRGALEQSQNSSAETHAALYNEIMRLRDATVTMNNQVNDTLLSSDNRAQQLRALATRLNDVTSNMETSMRTSEMSLSNSASLVEQVGVEVRDMMVRSGQEMVEASTVMSRELRDAANLAMAQAEVLSHVITREADGLHQASVVSAQTLDGATAAMEASRAELYASVMTSAEQIAQVVQKLESQRDQLEKTSGESAHSYNTLYRETNEVCDAIASLNAQVDNTVIATDDRAQELRSLIARLDKVTGNMQASMETSERLLSQSIGTISQVSTGARDMMINSGQEMVGMAAAMASDLRDAANQAMAQAEVLSHVITREADSLHQASSISAQTLDNATAAIETSRSALYASVTASAEQILRAVQSMEAQRNQMDRATIETTDSYGALFRETAELCQAIASLNAQVGDTMIVTDSRAAELRALTTRLGEVTMGMKAVLQSGQYNLMDSAELITKVSADARDIMMVSGSEIAEVTQQIAQNTSNITTAFQQQQDALQQSVTTGTDAIDGMVKKLEDTASNLSVATETSARDLDWLCGHIQSAGLAIGEMGVRAEDAMRNARESLVLSEASLQRTASSARINLSELSERYGNEGSRLGATHDSIEKTYGAAISRLETLGQELAGQSFHTFDSLNEMSVLFDAKIAQLRDGGIGVTSQLQDVAKQLQENYASLTLCAEKAAEQMAEIKSTLTGAQSDVSLTTEHANQQVDNVRRKLGVYAQDLMMMVSQASGQIEAASAGFNDRATAMTAVANENATQLGDMGARVRLEIEQLAQTVKAVTADQAGSLSTAVERLRAQAEELARQSQQSMIELERQGIRTTDNMRQINQGAEEATLKLRETSQQLMRQSEGIAIAGTDVAKRISQATQQMQMQTQAIKTTTDKAVAVMNESGEELTGQISQWQASAQKTQGYIRQMLDNMSEQMAAMEISSSKAEESAKRVTQADTRLKRDAFLNSAKFIIESLNSLSIDLTRVLDPQEADRVWKEFAKGDASAFTRRFLQMREEMPLQRLKEKYERDGEFRTYAMRYFRQFEELFEQALKNDHNDLLATTLTTSDVGKLYSYLAGALGHTQLKSVGSEKAA